MIARLLLHRSGNGSPAVVFLPGGGAVGLDYLNVQERAAWLTTSVIYDRAGTRWSDRMELPRNSAELPDELIRLYRSLFAAEITDWPEEIGERLIECHVSLEWLQVGLQEAKNLGQLKGLAACTPSSSLTKSAWCSRKKLSWRSTSRSRLAEAMKIQEYLQAQDEVLGQPIQQVRTHVGRQLPTTESPASP